jgi:YD repeat-containing protein
LGRGSLSARICDVWSNCTTRSWTVYRGTLAVVSPIGTVHTRTPLVLVRYGAPGVAVDTGSLIVRWGGVDVKALGRSNDGLFEWEVDGASHALSPGGSKQLYVYACAVGGACTSATSTVTLAASPQPMLSLKPMPLEAHGRQFAAPFGPGIGVSGAGDLEMAIATPAYHSLNAPRTAGLTYASRQAYPRALVNVDLEFPGSAPSALTMRLKDGGVTVDSAVFGSPTCSSGGTPTCRVALEAAFLGTSSYPAVRKWLRVEAQATVNGTPYTVYDSVEVVLVDRRTTPYGSGWWPSGIMRLVPTGEDAMLVASDGTASIFRGANQGEDYLAPPGNTSTLVKTGSTWELRFRGGGKVTFDSMGRQSGVVDINGNTVAITYNTTTDQVNRITDPIGKYFTFSYGNPNTTVSAITDPGGRQTTLTVDANRKLTSYAIPSGSLNYGGSFTWNTYTGSAVLPATRANALGSAVTIGYTAGLRPWRVVLPTVQDEYGANAQPTVQYYPQELKALRSLTALDQLYTEVIDARGNWSRAELNRWGDALRTWDAIGTLGTATYDPAGRVLTAEGKAGDSTRVHHTYDAFGRLARTYRVLNGGDTLRVDSIVYDGSHRAVRRLDAENRITETVYDANGNPIRVIAPNGATSYAWYGAYGQVDSTRGPTTAAAQRVRYEDTWRNTWKVHAPDSALLAQNTYDAYGRLSETQSRITVQVTSTTSKIQWRRRYGGLHLRCAGDPDRQARRHGHDAVARRDETAG